MCRGLKYHPGVLLKKSRPGCNFALPCNLVTSDMSVIKFQLVYSQLSVFRMHSDGGGESSASIVEDVCYSPELHGMAVVMGNGRAAFLTSQSARFEPSVRFSLSPLTIPLSLSPSLCLH